MDAAAALDPPLALVIFTSNSKIPCSDEVLNWKSNCFGKLNYFFENAVIFQKASRAVTGLLYPVCRLLPSLNMRVTFAILISSGKTPSLREARKI